MFTPLEGKVKIMNLDPGHFHAALVQKTMYERCRSGGIMSMPPGDRRCRVT